MQVKLKVLGGSHSGKEIPVSAKQFVVGRSEDCQLRPKTESVSRKHCAILIKEGRAIIQDLKSRNGTFVNGKQLPENKAKVLKNGDVLRIGKLEFEVVIEVGLGGPKRSEVKDVGDAAARTVAASEESRFEEVDISSWLNEADLIERKKKLGEPETRQLKLDETMQASVDETSNSQQSESKDEPSTAERIRELRAEKKEPGKLPKHLKQSATTNDSREAAGDALKRFFGGR